MTVIRNACFQISNDRFGIKRLKKLRKDIKVGRLTDLGLCQKGCIYTGMAVANAHDRLGKMSDGNHITLVWGHS